MSWDVILVRTKTNTEDWDDIKPNQIIPFLKKPTGDIFATLYSDIDRSDDEWLVVDNFADSFEVNLADTEQIMLHVNELSDENEFFNRICSLLNCRAFDTTSGKFMKLEV